MLGGFSHGSPSMSVPLLEAALPALMQGDPAAK
jgi:hypothetical protein